MIGVYDTTTKFTTDIKHAPPEVPLKTKGTFHRRRSF